MAGAESEVAMGESASYIKQELSRMTVENRALREEVVTLREYLGSIQALMDGVDDMDPKSEIMSLLDRILVNAMAVTHSSDGSLMVVDDETQELVFVLARGMVSLDKLRGVRIPLGKGIAGWVAKQGQPTIVNNARTDPRFFSGVDDAFQFKTNSVLAVPITGNKKVLGVIEVLNKQNGKAFSPTDQTLLTLLCRFAGEVLYSSSQQEEKSAARPAPAAETQ